MCQNVEWVLVFLLHSASERRMGPTGLTFRTVHITSSHHRSRAMDHPTFIHNNNSRVCNATYSWILMQQPSISHGINDAWIMLKCPFICFKNVMSYSTHLWIALTRHWSSWLTAGVLGSSGPNLHRWTQMRDQTYMNITLNYSPKTP